MQVQDLRKEYGCILTGINTVLNDNPYLFPRKNIEYSYKNYGSQKFYRVILDSNLRINLDSNIVKTSNLVKTIVFIEDKNKSKFTGKIKKQGFCEE